MKRLALIGAGFWGEFQTAAWREVEGAEVAAICDRDLERAQEAARRYGVAKVYADAATMFAAETLDFVDIAASPSAHESLVAMAATEGLPVICQKPMAPDYASCERMVATCQAAGVPFLIHENFRWQTPMRRVKAVLASGVIGRVLRAHVQFSHGLLDLFNNQPYLFREPHFALLDMGPHLLDLPRFFFGEPVSLYARERSAHPRFVGGDIVSVVLGYQDLTCHCELSWRTTDYEVFVEGTDGAVTWRTNGQLAIVTEAGEAVETLTPKFYPWADPRYGFAHASIVDTNVHLLAALSGSCRAETDSADNLKTMQLVDLALRSAASNQALGVR